jgi:glycerol-3-phosphate cytidylyltransferase
MLAAQRRVITFGTFDLFHIGHLNILRRSAALGNHLIVGVSTDALNFSKKGLKPVFPENERLAIVEALGFVNEAFYEESLELKGEYITRYKADVLVMGDDWAGRFDHFKNLCDVVYLPRTEGISTTEIKLGLSGNQAVPVTAS